jgi:hypothetical protein
MGLPSAVACAIRLIDQMIASAIAVCSLEKTGFNGCDV